MDTNKLKLAITKALAYTENGGKPDIKNTKAGKSGEMKSIFQLEPKTWHSYSKETTGQDNLPLTPESEAYVVHQKVSKWVDEGLQKGETPDVISSRIASIWNAGNPDAYKHNHKGTNSYGVAYDTPAYAQKVTNYTNEFLNDKQQSNQQENPQAKVLLAKLATIAKTAKPNQQNSSIATVPTTSNTSQGMLQNQPMAKADLTSKLPGLFGGNVKTI